MPNMNIVSTLVPKCATGGVVVPLGAMSIFDRFLKVTFLVI